MSSYDPYADCPCGSGKKIKFCCQDVIADMQKVSRLRENQPSRALQILKDLESGFPNNLWVASSHARLQMELGDYSEAKHRSQRFLENDGNDARNPEINAVLALASFVSDGYEAAKRNVHRAFQLSARSEPALLTRLAGAISMVMLEAESFMSARAHAALAVKLAPPDRRQHCVMQLAQIEGSSRIPYPLRSVHRLVTYSCAVEDQEDLDRAFRLSVLGCWQPATILLRRIVDRRPDCAEAWHNLGLCFAWDGNEPMAAEALHKAAALYRDEQPAVECEAIAQLLDLELTEEVNEIQLQSYTAQSVSKLLTVLDGEALFDRLSIEVPLDEEGPVAQYRLLERPFPTDREPSELGPEDIPEFIADVLVFDATDDRPAMLQITGVEGEGFEQADKTLNSILGDLIAPAEDADDEALGVVPCELADLEWNCHFPADFPAIVARDIETRKMKEVSDSIWPNLKLSALGNKSPKEAAADESLSVALKASVYVLDAFYDRNNVMLDVELVRNNLGLSSPPTLDPGGDNATRFSTITLQRIHFADLNDEQLINVARRVLLVRHTRTTYEALREVAKREVCLERLSAARVFTTLVGICREQNRRDEAFKWLEKGREAAATSADSFKDTLEWDVKELNLRLDDPTDEAIPTLWQKFEDQYFAKLPEIRDSIAMFMHEKGLGHLVGEFAQVGTGEGEGVWTPDAGREPEGEGGGKLWLPGQE